MKTAVFSFNPPTPDGSLANARTATFLSDTLKSPLICGPEIQDATDLDVLFLVAGVFMYCRVLPQVAKAIESAKHLVWVQNDYTIRPPLADGNAESPFRFAFRKRRMEGKSDVNYWTTMLKASQLTPASAYINWNAMAFEPELVPTTPMERQQAVIYYGADRAQRQIYFDRYFRNQEAPLVISSFQKSMGRFADDADVIPAWRRTEFHDKLRGYEMGLYLEDKTSHREFTSPATRFYEMLSCGVAMVFQPEAIPMLAHAGYAVGPYAAQPGDLPKLLSNARDIAAAQWAAWGGANPRKALEGAVRKEYKRLEKLCV